MRPVAVLKLEEAKRMVKLLESKGVPCALDHDDEMCQRGCAVTVTLNINEEQIHEFTKIYQQDFLGQLEIDSEQIQLLNEVFDPSQSQATCPACGTRFSTTAKECPDCGLCF